MEKRKINLGKLLAKTMKARGVSKIHVTKLLKTTRPTLNSRLKDGNFTTWQIELLIKENLLPITASDESYSC